MTIAGPKSSVRDILLLNFQLMIIRAEINLKKISGTSNLIKEIVNVGQWVLVLNGHLVQLTIIWAKSERTISFFCK